MFWLLFGAVGLGSISVALHAAALALGHVRTSERVVALALADQDMLQSTQGVLSEGAYTMYLLSLSNEERSANLARLTDVRREVASRTDSARQRLQAIGATDLLAHLDAAMAPLKTADAAADIALQQRFTGRDKMQEGTVMAGTMAILASLRAVQSTLDGDISANDPELTSVLLIKSQVIEAQMKLGFFAYTLAQTLATGTTWSTAELLTNARREGSGMANWTHAVELAENCNAVRLKRAMTLATEQFFSGNALAMRNSVLQHLVDGTPTPVDIEAFRQVQRKSVLLIGDVATAADDDVVELASQTARTAVHILVHRSIALLGAGAMVACGLWVQRSLRFRTLGHVEAAAAESRAIEDGLLRLAAQQAATAEAAALVVGSIGTGLERLAGGDLSFRLSQALPAPYEKLRTDLNSAFDELEAMVTQLVSGTGVIRVGIGEITRAGDELNQRTQRHTSSLHQTTAAVSDVAAMVRTTGDIATHAKRVVAETKAGAQQSEGVVQRAVAAMGGIEQSSKQIGKIVGVIDKIAAQTNLLALNAGVEAARAGEAGRGFAVVASEVKLLAARSADAAKQIKHLITSSTDQVSDGAKLVGEAGQSFVRIVSQVGEISQAVLDIAASAKEQDAGLLKMDAAIEQLDQIARQNAKMVDQSTAATHDLAVETEALVRLTGRFKTNPAPHPTRRPLVAAG